MNYTLTRLFNTHIAPKGFTSKISTVGVLTRVVRTYSQIYRNQYIYLKRMSEDKSKNIIWIDMEVIIKSLTNNFFKDDW